MVFGLIASYPGIVDIMQDYDELNEILITSGACFHASECHGLLCALICGNGRVQEQKIRDFFLIDITSQVEGLTQCWRFMAIATAISH